MTSAAIVDALAATYAASVAALRGALAEYLRTGTPPDPALRRAGAFAYPEVRLTYRGGGAPRLIRAFARVTVAGDYAATVTHPELFRDYLVEQLDLLIADFGVEVSAGRSGVEIPYPYVLDGAEDLRLDAAAAAELARHFPTTELAHIGDELPDGLWLLDPHRPRPLALFDAPRTDFSLARLRHYTGTPAAHVQRYVLFTNYHRYVDEFVAWACRQLRGRHVVHRAVVQRRRGDRPRRARARACHRRRRMAAAPDAGLSPDGTGRHRHHPRQHRRRPVQRQDDHRPPRGAAARGLADDRPLRRPAPSQTIGDYVLAHAYLRDDHVLDDVLPPEIPIPPIAEVQLALSDAAEAITGDTGEALKRRLRTGTVVTTDDRNWELRYSRSALRFNQSRAVAIDMESATIAAQGYRFRVPYGTLLCVSDKPLHGEIKLPGQANRFYEGAISEHLQIGIAAIDRLRAAGDRLHSRKLRAFDEPPFR